MTRRGFTFLVLPAVLLLFFSLLLTKPFSNNIATAQVGDAIAVRVLPNPNHYSPAEWYKKQGFKGEPTPFKVDGYDAVRDGRTAYVNVANVINKCDCFSNVETCTCAKDITTCDPAIYSFSPIPASAFPSGLTSNCYSGDVSLSFGAPTEAQMNNRYSTAPCSTQTAPEAFWVSTDFSNPPPFCSSCTDNIGSSVFSTEYIGTINLPETGNWIFASQSDDNSDLYIDGVKVLECYQSGAVYEPSQCKTGKIYYTAGNHTIKYRAANQGWGPMAARLYWSTPASVAASEAAPVCHTTRTPSPCDGTESARNCTNTRVPVSCSVMPHDVVCAGDSLYTNIYLISYNQEAEAGTLSVFDKILSKWRFNTNLSTPGKCFNRDGEKESCLVDADCSEGYFCNSEKARLTRDTVRLGGIVSIREKIEEYGKKYSKYPTIQAGTYLPGKTISTWPSWSSSLGSSLGIELPTDPVNFLGKCNADDTINAKYDKNTCWSDADKSFADANPASPEINLPPGSNAFVYESLDNGLGYNACAYMESGYLVDGSLGACKGSYNPNQAPTIDCGSLMAITGKPFEGYIRARDIDDTKISLVASQVGAAAAIFTISDTDNPASKKISVANVPGTASGAYTIDAVAYDEHGNSTNKSCLINVQNESFITYPVPDQKTIIGKKIAFSVYSYHSNKEYTHFEFHFSNSALSCMHEPILTSDGRYRCDVEATPTGAIPRERVSVYTTNTAGEATPTQSFYFEVYNNPPVISPIKCSNKVRVSTLPTGGAPGHYNYECKISATDPDGHTVSFPPGSITGDLGISGLVHSNSGVISGFSNVTTAGDYNITITAIDSYGAVSSPVGLPLKIVNFCGDGIKQTPNTESKGGPKDDGYENCDGTDGTPTPALSTSIWQYGCNSGNCTPLNAGYCGDGVVQAEYGEDCDDGNFVDGDGCNTFNGSVPSCKWTCNDGTVSPSIGEQCDFGRDTNCCNSCGWTTGPTTWVDVAGDGSLASGGSLSLNIPPCRGVVGGTFDATPLPFGPSASPETGTTIVFITDISGSMFDPTYASAKQTVSSSIERFYNEANSKNINIHVGTIATYANGVNKIVPISNLNNTYGGSVQRGTLHASVNTYASLTDNPAFAASYNQAASMINSYTNAADGEKYIIFLTDGYPASAAATAAANAAKALGIKIYIISFNFWSNTWQTDVSNLANSLRGICACSSDNNVYTDCFTTNYSRRKTSASVDPIVVLAELNSMYDSIIAQILSKTPTGITYSVNGVSSPLTSYEDAPFSPPNPCAISGAGCSPSTFNFSTAFTGSGEMRYNNFRLNIIPLCE